MNHKIDHDGNSVILTQKHTQTGAKKHFSQTVRLKAHTWTYTDQMTHSFEQNMGIVHYAH